MLLLGDEVQLGDLATLHRDIIGSPRNVAGSSCLCDKPLFVTNKLPMKRRRKKNVRIDGNTDVQSGVSTGI